MRNTKFRSRAQKPGMMEGVKLGSRSHLQDNMKDCNIQIGSLHCGMITEAK
jgi:hypothetical protein